MSACIVDTCQFFDPATRQWGYEVACLNMEEHDCTTDQREIIRDPASDPVCDACGLPITEDPHTPADLTFHPECCPDPDCPRNEGA